MHIAILSSSTRISRQSHRVALGLEKRIHLSHGHTAEVLDLNAYEFPIMEEVLHKLPSPPDGLSDFAQRVHQADAHIFVSPEYNGSYTAALKNAVDYLKENEFSRKVIGVASVSVGGHGGMRCALAMQQLALAVGAFVIPQMLLVGNVTQRFDESGNLTDPSFEQALKLFLGQFFWLGEAVFEKKQLANSI